MKHILAAGALVALLAGTPALASASQGREAVAVKVQTSDINLSDPAALEKARARLNRAIAAACNPGDRLNADTRPDWQCRREMAASAEPAMQQLAALAQAQRLSMN